MIKNSFCHFPKKSILFSIPHIIKLFKNIIIFLRKTNINAFPKGKEISIIAIPRMFLTAATEYFQLMKYGIPKTDMP